MKGVAMVEQKCVYVLDTDHKVLLSVEALYQSECDVRTFSTAIEFLHNAEHDSVGCLITDVQVPDADVFELLRKLQSIHSPISTVVVTGVADVPLAVELMECGAVTLVEKPWDNSKLARAIDRALLISHERWHKQQGKHHVSELLATLSEEEHLVMKKMLAGLPNKAIASALNLSMRTVDRRRHSVLEKMQVKSVPELAVIISAAHDVLNSI